MPSRSTLSTPLSAKIAADLLRDAHADMLGDLLGAAHMRRDLGDRLEDEVQIADRDALGEQQLQHRLQARIGDLRRADVLDQALVFGIEPIEQRAHVLVGQELRQVVADDLAQMREQHRHVVDATLKPSRLTSSAKVSGIHIAFMPKAGSTSRRPARPGLPIAVKQHEHLADAKFVLRHDGAVDLDLVALGADRQIVGQLDLRNRRNRTAWQNCGASC